MKITLCLLPCTELSADPGPLVEAGQFCSAPGALCRVWQRFSSVLCSGHSCDERYTE